MKRLAFIAVAGLAMGCQPRYDDLHFDEVRSGNPQSIQANSDNISVLVGIASAVRVTPDARGYKDYKDYHLVELESRDPDILDVRPGPELDTFVLMGRYPGTTHVIVSIRDNVVDRIAAEVRRQ